MELPSRRAIPSPGVARNRSRLTLAIVVTVALTAAAHCTAVPSRQRVARTSHDGGAIADSTTLERVGPGVISTQGGEAFPALSPDGRTLWFATHDDDWSHHQIVLSRLEAGEWSAPEPAPFSGAEWSDRAPRPSPDGRRLYFASNRPRPGETTHDPRDYDLWVVEREAEGGWSRPSLVPDPVSTSNPEYHPSPAASGALYFASFDRPGGRGRSDLYVGRPAGDGGDRWTVETLGDAINSTTSEPDVYVDPAERFLIATSTDRPEGLGHDDLFLSVRRPDGWSPLVHLGEPVNSDAYEYGATLSPDGRWLWFTSHRGGSADIYRIETRSIPALARALEAPPLW